MRIDRFPAFVVAFFALYLGADLAHQSFASVPKSYEPRAEQCLALNVYWEARSESELGQKAVAAVTLNRVKSEAFPNDICSVVRQGGERRHRCQFSWWCDGKKDTPTDRTAWDEAVRIAQAALDERLEDPTHGALFYHATYVNPSWAGRMTKTRKIGQHIFFKDPTLSADNSPMPVQNRDLEQTRLGERIIASLF
ncbi:cell wall hydrolase [Magnetovibrio sp. PR-2]|uniref:cell wall hydrolase n=1 Tax=Magnetovibrio sp. PR-2 TaxID=3120356 RepID=UPI002FCDFBAE